MDFYTIFTKLPEREKKVIEKALKFVGSSYAALKMHYKSQNYSLLKKSTFELRCRAGVELHMTKDFLSLFPGLERTLSCSPSESVEWSEIAWEVWRLTGISSIFTEQIPVAVLIILTTVNGELRSKVEKGIEYYAKNKKIDDSVIIAANDYLKNLPERCVSATVDQIIEVSRKYVFELPYLSYNDVHGLLKEGVSMGELRRNKPGELEIPFWWRVKNFNLTVYQYESSEILMSQIFSSDKF